VKIDELIGSGRDQVTMDRVPIERVSPYSCEDADLALQLCRLLGGRLEEEGLAGLFADMELPLVPVLADMEWVGVKVDADTLTAVGREFEEELTELEKDILREAGEDFNISSPRQLSRVLFEKLACPPARGAARDGLLDCQRRAVRSERTAPDCGIRFCGIES